MRTVLTTAILIALSGMSALAQSVPQVCHDSSRQIGETHEYEAAIKSATQCLELGAGGYPEIAYHNRAAAGYLHWYEDLDIMTAEADNVLANAYDDIERAIQLDPNNGVSYCIRANIVFNQTYGEDGYDDIDRGLALGAPKETCVLR
jgi:hypothetical protein